ncbi:MAG: KUP/HAK/KT family potassium transporter [Polyangiaceae bacterium]
MATPAPPAAESAPRSRTKDIHAVRAPGRASKPALAILALGVVFGDLGTSPLYTLQECLSGPHGVTPTDANVLGILSMVLWSLMLVVTFKYMLVLMRAHNQGEGGIMALLALAPTRLSFPAAGKVGVVALLAIVGAALLFGDGMITPSVSVLSAIEGLEVASKEFHPIVVPATVVILVLLFAVQRRGTAKLGKLFGPVMLLWFLVAAALGAYHIAREPGVLRALSPTYAGAYFLEHGIGGIGILGGVILCVTGGEALYADMGHFGPGPIRNAWLFVCVPSLVANYFGQGALLLSQPDSVARATLAARPFYSMCPQGAWLYPFVGIAALATIIASQALISGVFSLTYQAVQLGFFPRLTVRHTSDEAEGQIYIPLMNWGLAVACVLLVLVFQESGKLAAAFGLAVSGTMAITSFAFFVVARYTWRWPLWKAGGLTAVFLAFDLPFLVANTFKFLDGGYLPFSVGAVFVILMINWRVGRGLLGQHMKERSEPLATFIAELAGRVDRRCDGQAVFMASGEGLPPAMRRVVSRFRVLHEQVFLLTVVFEHVPHAPARVGEVLDLGQGITRVTLHYGYVEEPDVHGDLSRALTDRGIDVAHDRMLYVLGRETFVASNAGRMGRIAEGLFAFLSRNARGATDYFRLPPEQVLELGAHIDL